MYDVFRSYLGHLMLYFQKVKKLNFFENFDFFVKKSKNIQVPKSTKISQKSGFFDQKVEKKMKNFFSF